MKYLLNRMCWNSRGWRLPTGNSSDGGYPSRRGYGHEEWNFQFDDAFNDYLYGFTIYTPPDSTINKAEGQFRIGFWTRHPDTGVKFLVGIYHNATLMTQHETDVLYNFFEAEGIFNRRTEELLNISDNISREDANSDVRNAVRDHWIKWKCRVNEVELLPQYLPLPDAINGKTIGAYFTNPTFIDADFFASLNRRNQGGDPTNRATIRQTPLAEDAYFRESARNLRVIIPLHNRLSNRFCDWLRANGATNVIQERNQVDVSFAKPNGTYLAELKSCYGVGTTKSIREAIGQLFEYNYYSLRTPANFWLIILDEHPSKSDRQYIQTIASKYELPLRLGWSSGAIFQIDGQNDEL